MSRQVYELIERIRELEEQVEKERNKFVMVLQSIVDGVYVTDLDRKIMFWNKGAERITGFRADEVIGRTCKDILAHVDMRGASLCEHHCPISETFRMKEAVIGKDVYTNTSFGRPLPVSVSCSPVLDQSGNAVGAIEVFRDISERVRLESQKADFYSMVTHDLKSPLQAISGYGEILRDSEDDPQRKEFLGVILKSADTLNSMVNDFLSLSRFQAGTLRPQVRPARLGDLFATLRERFAPVGEAKGVRFVTGGADVPPFDFDPVLLERALSNLLANAFKFTQASGEVKLSSALDEGAGAVTITVSDTGVGFPEDERDKIFEAYHRARTASGIEGTGLGLAVTKAVAEAHGGSVRADSRPGEGSVFTLLLPFRTGE